PLSASFIKIEGSFFAFRKGFAQPRRRRALENVLQLRQQLRDIFGLVDFHRMDVVRDYPRRTRSADRSDIENSAILDRLDLGSELVLIAVFLEIAIELNGFEE